MLIISNIDNHNIMKKFEKSKIINIDNLAKITKQLKKKKKKIVLCHGVFDLLHIGHIKHFQEAKKNGDILIVTLTADEYVKHINHVKDYLDVVAKSHGYKLSTKASGEINPIYLDSEEAQTFGCEPDFNVYLKDMNIPPNTDTNLRCVGGHVHIGYPEPDFEKSERIVKMFDIFVTLPSLLIDTDERRRELYG